MYCRTCGAELTDRRQVQDGFDTYTGEPIIHSYALCPNRPRSWWGRLLEFMSAVGHSERHLPSGDTPPPPPPPTARMDPPLRTILW